MTPEQPPKLQKVFFADLDLAKQEDVIVMLQRLYASEIVAREQYRAHAVEVVGPNCIQLAQLFNSYADEEDEHAKELLDRIDALGGSLDNKLTKMVDLNPTSDPDAGDVQVDPDTGRMLRYNIIAESDAIAAYTEGCLGVQHTDPATYILLAHILGEEWHHRRELKNVLGVKN
jgi:ferritin-like protein